MFAVIAAIVFGIALILDWADVKTSDAFTPGTLLLLGLFFIALHLAFNVAVPYIRREPR